MGRESSRRKEKEELTLHKSSQNLTPRLQKRMPNHNLQKLLQPRPPALNNIIAKPIRKHLPRQRRNGHPRTLPLENIAKVLKVGIAPAHGGLAQLEGRDIGAADDLVVGVHVAADAVGAGVADLDLEEVFGGPVDLVEGLLAGVGHGLEDGAVEARGGGGCGGCGCRPFTGGGAGGVVGRRGGGGRGAQLGQSLVVVEGA